jgi:TPP-dependent pyruvate/acetoin dehydrogenase alpha subunit
MTYTRADAERIIEKMLLIRLVEEEIVARYGISGKDQEMRCPVHLSIGQEAAAVGACHHLSRADNIFSTHRCHAHYLAKGGDLDKMVLELHGKLGGCIDGRGGSMHLMDNDAGVTMSVPIVASSIPLAVGTALASKIDNKSEVVLSFFGDASVEEGVFHESVNFASLMNLPVIFVCENNLFSVYTHISKRQPDRALADIGVAHKINTVTMDGSDPFIVANAFNTLITDARTKKQPSLIILDTYRWREHCGVNFDDHLGYRDKQEILAWKEKDPMTVAVETAISKELLTQAEIDAMSKKIKSRIEKSFDAAKLAPLPIPEMARKYVYAD